MSSKSAISAECVSSSLTIRDKLLDRKYYGHPIDWSVSSECKTEINTNHPKYREAPETINEKLLDTLDSGYYTISTLPASDEQAVWLACNSGIPVECVSDMIHQGLGYQSTISSACRQSILAYWAYYMIALHKIRPAPPDLLGGPSTAPVIDDGLIDRVAHESGISSECIRRQCFLD